MGPGGTGQEGLKETQEAALGIGGAVHLLQHKRTSDQ